MEIIPEALHEILKEAGIPVLSVRSNGEVIFSRELDPQEEATAQDMIDNFDPATKPQRENMIDTATQIAQELNGTDIRNLDAAGRIKLIGLMAVKLGWVNPDFTLNIHR